MPVTTGLAIAAFTVLVIGAPQLLGGVYPWGMVATALAGVVALSLALAGDPYTRLLRSPIMVAVFGALLWTALQAAPLPCGLVERLPVASAEELQRTHHLLGLPAPSWCTISRDPGATREELIKGVAILSSFLTAWLLARSGYRRGVYRAIAASGVALALVGVAHTLLGAERVFGLYKPLEIRDSPMLSPVLNPNSAGGFMAMCVPLLIGLALTERSAPARLTAGVSAAFIASAVLMTRSRGAIGALAVGVMLLAALSWLKQPRRRAGVALSLGQQLERLGIPVVIVLGLGLGVYASYSEIVREFEGGTWDKLDVIARGVRFSREHLWVGVGRGAFSATFATFYNTHNRFEYAENFVVQWISEWGAPVALLLLIALAAAYARALRRAVSLDRLGGLAGVAAIALQNLVEIGFELVSLAAVAAALFGASLSDRSPAARQAPGHRRAARFALPLGFAALLASLWVPVHRDHRHYLEQRLRAQFEANDQRAFRAVLQGALLAHPSEPIFVVIAAANALRANDKHAGRWVNRGLQLVPGWPAPHLQAAHWLLRAGQRKQALLELGIGVSLGRFNSRGLLCPIAEVDLPMVAEVRLKNVKREAFLRLLSACFHPDSVRSAELDALILREFPRDPRAQLRQAERLLRAGDAAGALASALAAESLAQPAVFLQGRALAALDRKQDALAALRRAEQPGGPVAISALHEQARLFARLKDREGLQEVLGRLRGITGDRAQDMAQSLYLEAAAEVQMGNPAAALAAFEAAYGITGETAALRSIADLANKMGDRRRAAWAYAQLCDLSPNDSRVCGRKTELLRVGMGEQPARAAQPKPE